MLGPAWWHRPVLPATQEAEAGAQLEVEVWAAVCYAEWVSPLSAASTW